MGDVAAKAMVSKPTVYKYFPDKERLALMQPQVLRLRRLVIANAGRLPALGRSWYEEGFERVLATLAAGFRSLTERGLLQADDPKLAAHHFAGLLLWIPVNKAMFTGDHHTAPGELESCASAAVRAFLDGYGVSGGKLAAPPKNGRGECVRISAG
jgi:TetR/AcrR family transcriptional repressor of mexJK operon